MMTQKKPKRMRCVSFCTAISYDLAALANSLDRKSYLVKLSRDVLSLRSIRNGSELFIFNHGSFVCWGLTKRAEQKWIHYIKTFARDPLTNVEMDFFSYQIGDDTTIISHERFKLDIITLESTNPQLKLAISYGLAQSIKLESFEAAIQVTVQKNNILPTDIANYGSITLSRSAIFKRIGEIFLARSSINLNSEFLDTPEFFWRNPNLEMYYTMTSKFLDIPARVTALNQKLDVLQELLDILNTQLQHRHSTLLETIIIALIMIEILISVFQLHVW
jgi:uncharacterized Rmd1/YagE family protein